MNAAAVVLLFSCVQSDLSRRSGWMQGGYAADSGRFYIMSQHFFFLSYLFHVRSSSVDAAQIVNTSDAHTHTQRLDTLQSHN